MAKTLNLSSMELLEEAEIPDEVGGLFSLRLYLDNNTRNGLLILSSDSSPLPSCLVAAPSLVLTPGSFLESNRIDRCCPAWVFPELIDRSSTFLVQFV